MGYPNTARLFDIWVGICCCHPPSPCVGMAGILIVSQNVVFTDSRNNFRCGDITIGFCGHPGVIATCSSVMYSEHIGQARVGDLVVGCNIGVIVTGSPKTSNQ